MTLTLHFVLDEWKEFMIWIYPFVLSCLPSHGDADFHVTGFHVHFSSFFPGDDLF